MPRVLTQALSCLRLLKPLRKRPTPLPLKPLRKRPSPLPLKPLRKGPSPLPQESFITWITTDLNHQLGVSPSNHWQISQKKKMQFPGLSELIQKAISHSWMRSPSSCQGSGSPVCFCNRNPSLCSQNARDFPLHWTFLSVPLLFTYTPLFLAMRSEYNVYFISVSPAPEPAPGLSIHDQFMLLEHMNAFISFTVWFRVFAFVYTGVSQVTFQ